MNQTTTSQNSWIRSPILQYTSWSFFLVWLVLALAALIFYFNNKNFDMYIPQLDSRSAELSIMVAKFTTLSFCTLFVGICTYAADWAIYGHQNSLILQSSPIMGDPSLFVGPSNSIFRNTGFSRALLLTPMMVLATLVILIVFDFFVLPVPFSFDISDSQMYLVTGITFVILWIINGIRSWRRGL